MTTKELYSSIGVSDIAAVAATEPAALSLTPPASIDDTTPCCPKCKAKMRWIGSDEKRSWRIVMYSLLARTGTEMIEALLDNTEQHQFVNHLRSARISSCWAWHWNLSNWRSPFIRRTSIELLFTTHNRCVRLDRNHCTGQNPGDKLSATR